MPPKRDEARTEMVRALASEGWSVREISEEKGIPERTVRRDLQGLPRRDPRRLPDGQGSRRTLYRQQARARE